MSATVNTLGDAFSQVLVASKDEAKEAMRQGCYDYLCSGGFRTSGLMALLGGMNPTFSHPPYLRHHFYLHWAFALSLSNSSTHLAQPQAFCGKSQLNLIISLSIVLFRHMCFYNYMLIYMSNASQQSRCWVTISRLKERGKCYIQKAHPCITDAIWLQPLSN